MTPVETSLFWDLLSFRLLITPSLLLIIYYLGAVFLPILLFHFVKSTREAIGNKVFPRKGQLRESVSSKNKGITTLVVIVLFVAMELFWRMIFEFFIAYFQIHNALMSIS